MIAMDSDGTQCHVDLPEKWVKAMNRNSDSVTARDLAHLRESVAIIANNKQSSRRVKTAKGNIKILAKSFGMKLKLTSSKKLDSGTGKRRSRVTSAQLVPVLPTILSK
eukprot:UC4_evm4s161